MLSVVGTQNQDQVAVLAGGFASQQAVPSVRVDVVRVGVVCFAFAAFGVVAHPVAKAAVRVVRPSTLVVVVAVVAVVVCVVVVVVP